MQPVERLHPHEAAQLIRPQQAAKRLGAGLAILVHAVHKACDGAVRLDGQTAVFQQARHVRRAEGRDLHDAARMALLRLLVLLRGVRGGLRQLAPLVHVREVEERAVPQPEIALAIAQRLQNGQHLRRRLAVLAHLKLERTVLHAQRAGEVRLARGHALELVGAVDLRGLAQRVDALGEEAVDQLLSGEHDAALLHAEARGGELIERGALSGGVAQHEQIFLARHRRRGRSKRIDLLVAVAEDHLRDDYAVLAVEVRAHVQRAAHDALGQRAVEGDASGALEGGQQLGDHARALRCVKPEGRLPLTPGGKHHAHDALLLARQAQHVSLAVDKPAVRVERAQGRGHLCAHLDLPAAPGDAEEQLRLSVEHAGNGIDLLAEGDPERLGHQQLHEPRHEARRQREVLGLKARLRQMPFELADVGSVLQQADDLLIDALKAHPLRLEHEALAEGHAGLVLQAREELRHRLDDVHALLSHAQADAHGLRLADDAQRHLQLKRRLHRQRALQRAHQQRGVFARAAATHLLDRAGGHGLHHGGGQMAAGLVDVAEKVAGAAAAELAERAHAHHAPRIAVHDVAQHAVLLLQRVHAARAVERQSGVIFLIRRDAPEHFQPFCHVVSPFSSCCPRMGQSILYSAREGGIPAGKAHETHGIFFVVLWAGPLAPCENALLKSAFSLIREVQKGR